MYAETFVLMVTDLEHEFSTQNFDTMVEETPFSHLSPTEMVKLIPNRLCTVISGLLLIPAWENVWLQEILVSICIC